MIDTKYLPLEYLEEIGQVRVSSPHPPLEPFTSDVPFELDATIFEQVCPDCDELFEGETCDSDLCRHAECEDFPCQDCCENMADRAHDMSDMER